MSTRVAPRLTAVVLTVLLGAGTAAFAPAAPATDAVVTPPGVELEMIDGEVRRTVAGLADHLGLAPGADLRDPMTWFERSRRIVEAHGVDTAAALDGACVDGCDEEPGRDQEPDDGEVWAFTTPTGDLDGDGTDDVLELAVEFGEEGDTSSTTARSGTDGRVLWASEGDGLAFAGAVPDLDGDGRADLVSVQWVSEGEFAGGCTDPLGVHCAHSETWHDTVTVAGLRGVTGAPIGSHELASTFTLEDQGAVVAGPTGWSGGAEVRITVEDGFFGFALIDVDGDGTHQLVHETFDASFTQRTAFTVNDTPLGWADVVGDHTVEELSGGITIVDLAAGTTDEVMTVSDALPFGWVVARPGGDRLLVDVIPEHGEAITGCAWIDPVGADCADDRGLPTSDGSGAAPTRVLHDATFEPVWEVPLPPTSFFVHGAGADLNGDGTEDLFDLGFDEETLADVVTAVDGATGEALWTAPATVGAADGATVVAARLRWQDELAVDGLVLDAATGAVLAERELAAHQEPDAGEDTVVSSWIGIGVQQLTAGSLDVLVDLTTSVHEMEEGCETWEEPDGSTVEACWYGEGDLVSRQVDVVGAEGGDLTEIVHLQDPSFVLLDALELDGDGDAELLGVEVGDGGPWSLEGPTRALQLDATSLWELAAPAVPVGPVGTADGSADLLVEDRDAGTASVLDGADLTVRWSTPLG